MRSDEIEKISALMPNLKVLSLYAFENYIYHPDNIAELGFEDFNKDEYIKEITKQKNDNLLNIVSEIGTARSHYIEFKDCIKNDENLTQIISCLQSNKFDDFYPYLNLKKYFNKNQLVGLNVILLDLAKTRWFKDEILKIISGRSG